ncbi:amyloid-beta-like protein [Condylostylus longicornis]|uniref:amyloid-beta-like protein n=1 Tax=Condylostylus longicornis TaxID=2530218 RepID=UPI00244E3A5D|nr:amyloid-beta-like protein [Condylostylus longicornis]
MLNNLGRTASHAGCGFYARSLMYPLTSKEIMSGLLVYPNRDITNIVESSHYQKIGGWCRQGAVNAAKCKGAHRWIKPFRCLEGPFQSDALLVPEGCLFDHIHNASRCWPFVRWNQTGAAACQERGMQMRSFAMLLPCGISLFSGVEFVCCPKHFKETVRVKKTDLPVIVPEEVIPSVDEDASDDSQDDDDEDAMDNEDSMLADEASNNDDEEAEEEEDGDYDSSEDFESENTGDEQNDSWDTISTQKGAGPLSGTTSTTTSSSIIVTNSQTKTNDNNGSGNTQNSNNSGNNNNIAPVAQAQAQSTSTSQPTVDPYFTHFDPRLEHQSYKVSRKEAQQRIEETHREKVTKVMKDWSDLEEKYQDMRLADPKAAATFKQRMTARFQTSVQALEEEGNAEKHQLAAMHQQRVLAHINQRKREAMTCYTQALTEQPPNAHRVEKCLQKLLRALHKDRAHALAHYRHLLNSGGSGGLDAAASERPRTLERLIDIDRAVNQSMTMLKRYPDLSAKISQLMNDYIQALRSKDDIPGSMLGMSEEAEAQILDKYRIEIERKVSEKERQRLAEKQRKEQRAAEREKLREEKLRMEAKKLDALVKEEQEKEKEKEQREKDVEAAVIGKNAETEANVKEAQTSEITTSAKPTESVQPTVINEDIQGNFEDSVAAIAHKVAEPKVQHAQAHDFGHGEPNFAMRHEIFNTSNREGRNVYFTLAFAGVALMAAVFVGIAVAKWRTARSPHSQGFIEVDQTACNMPVTPEERHVANMQINGYENPTYKYFEVKE